MRLTIKIQRRVISDGILNRSDEGHISVRVDGGNFISICVESENVNFPAIRVRFIEVDSAVLTGDSSNCSLTFFGINSKRAELRVIVS